MLKLKLKLTRLNGYDESVGFRTGEVVEGTLDGEFFIEKSLGHLFMPNQFEILEAQKDELVLVRDGDDHTWEARYFSHREKDLFYCFKYSQTSKETNEVESWKVLQRIELVD